MILSRIFQTIGPKSLCEATCGPVAIYISKRGHKFWPESQPTTDVFMPKNIEDRKLPPVPHIPQRLPEGVVLPYKHPRACDDMRGPERIHNQLIYKQYGLIALGGGSLLGTHYDIIRKAVDKYMDTERFFAVWRVDPPWKPVSKKSLGKRRGGGKTKVHHYEYPIRAGRIIFEIAGMGHYGEIEKILVNLASKMPFYAMPISQQIMDDLKKEQAEMRAKNMNPFEYRDLVRRNFGGIQSWVPPKDGIWGGTYY